MDANALLARLQAFSQDELGEVLDLMGAASTEDVEQESREDRTHAIIALAEDVPDEEMDAILSRVKP